MIITDDIVCTRCLSPLSDRHRLYISWRGELICPDCHVDDLINEYADIAPIQKIPCE